MKSFKLKTIDTRKDSTSLKRVKPLSEGLMGPVKKAAMAAVMAVALTSCGHYFRIDGLDSDSSSNNNGNGTNIKENPVEVVDKPVRPEEWCGGEKYPVLEVNDTPYAIRDGGKIRIGDKKYTVDLDEDDWVLKLDDVELNPNSPKELGTEDGTFVVEWVGVGDTNRVNVANVDVCVNSEDTSCKAYMMDWSLDAVVDDISVEMDGVYSYMSFTDSMVYIYSDSWTDASVSSDGTEYGSRVYSNGGSVTFNVDGKYVNLDLKGVGSRFAEAYFNINDKQVVLKPDEKYSYGEYDISVKNLISPVIGEIGSVTVLITKGDEVVREIQLNTGEVTRIEIDSSGILLEVRYLGSEYACNGDNSQGITEDH